MFCNAPFGWKRQGTLKKAKRITLSLPLLYKMFVNFFAYQFNLSLHAE